MNSDRDATLTAMYRAFNDRDIDGVLVHVHPDVDWANGMTGGRVHGRSEVGEYWAGQWKQIDPRVEPLSMETDAGGKVHVRVHQLVTGARRRHSPEQEARARLHVRRRFVKRMDIVDTREDDDADDDEENGNSERLDGLEWVSVSPPPPLRERSDFPDLLFGKSALEIRERGAPLGIGESHREAGCVACPGPRSGGEPAPY